MAKVSVKQLRRRSGVVLTIVIIALIVASLITAALIESIAHHHRQIKQAEQRQQAEWFARAAMQRAVQTLSKDAQYAGESWTSFEPSATQLNYVANIRVVSTTEPARERLIEVTVSTAHGAGNKQLYISKRTIKLPGPGGSS